MDPKTSKIIGTEVWVCDMQDSNKDNKKPIRNTEPISTRHIVNCAFCCLKCCKLVIDNAQNERNKILKNITY
jgi:hypothetical protein